MEDRSLHIFYWMGRRQRLQIVHACITPTHLNLPGGTTWASALLMVTWAWHSFLSILRLKCVVRVLWSLMISGRYCKALRRGSCRWKNIYFSTKSMVMRLKREARSQYIQWCLLCHNCRIAILYTSWRNVWSSGCNVFALGTEAKVLLKFSRVTRALNDQSVCVMVCSLLLFS